MAPRLPDVLDRLRSPRIFVVGDLILDRYVWGSVNRVSPEAPVQILDVAREEFRAGGAANVARNLAALEARSGCAGVVGPDEGGRTLLRLLRAQGIDVSHIVRDAVKPTSVKTRMIAHNQQMLRVDRERTDPITGATERKLVANCARAARGFDAALVSDYNKGTLTRGVCESLIRSFRRAGKPVLVGLKGRDYRKYAHATGASLNRAELAQISGEDGLDAGASKIIREMRLEFLVMTLGERGMRVFDRRGRSFDLPAVARQVYDVTGAGDTALAAFGLGYTSGLALEECAALANAAAGIVVAKVGTEVVTREELRLQGGDGHHKILPARALVEALRAERRGGRKIAFTNGCFDVLHVGHVRLLQFAKAKGDVLVVGLNSDRSVRAIKGDSRPILGERERAELLAALESVDYVTLFDDETPARLIRTLQPDVLVKGEDYAGKTVIGRETVERRGGRVEYAPFVKGLSTTDIVDRIRRRT